MLTDISPPKESRHLLNGSYYSVEFADFFKKKWLDTYPVTAQCVGRFFRTDGKYLSRVYKEHLSGFDGWEQKEHAGEWVLLEENMGERLSKCKTRKKAKKALHKWYKNVGKTRIREIISVRDTIKSKEEYILNYFNNRSTNASAESFNSKVKGLRAQVHGVNDLPFFIFRCAKIFG